MARITPSSVPGARRLIGRVDQAMRWRADEQIRAHLDGLNGRIEGLDDRVDALVRRLDDLDRRLEELRHEGFWTAEEMRRVAPQVAALDERLEEWRESARPLTGTPAEVAEARNVVDVVRREHQRVRTRLSGIAWYEDRLRRLEDTVDQLSQRSAGAEEPHDGVDDAVDVGDGHRGE